MPKVTTALRHLSDIDVQYVSLVDRGANRIPFRIVKRHVDGNQQENSMLDLNKLGIRKSDKPVAPAVTALVLKGSTESIALQVQTLLKAEGLEFDHLIKGEDGTFTLAADEAFDKGATAVEAGKDVVAVLKAFDPYCTPLKDMSFAEAASARGFYSSIDSASRTYSDAVYTQLYEATNPSDAAAEIKKLSTEFTQYVSTMVAGLPSKVFKFEKLVVSAKEAVAKADADKAAAEAKAAEEKAALEKSEAAAQTAAPSTPETPTEGASEQVQKAEEPKQAPEIAALLEAVKGLTATVQKSSEDSAKAIADLKVEQEKLQKSVEAVDQKARSAETSAQVLKNAVVGSDAGGETQVQQTPVKKSDDPYTGVFDTALLPRRR